MQKWEYTFEETSKADWLEQIKQDLKGKNVGELNREWWPDEPLIPIHHMEDHEEPVKLPDFLFKNPAVIIEEFDGASFTPEALNDALKSCLTFGTQQIILHPGSHTETALPRILDGIFPEMVTWHVHHENQFDPWFSGLIERAPDSTFLRIARNTESKNLIEVVEQFDNLTSSLKFNYTLIGSGNWLEECIQKFRQLLDDLENWIGSGRNLQPFLDSCLFTFLPDPHYFKQIIQVRCLHLLWQNLYETLSGKSSKHIDYLETHIYPGSTQNPDTYLLHASSAALSAIMAGSPGFCIHPIPSDTIPGFYQRIDRNINHLLFMESGFPSGSDPISGAYTLDFYTRKWTSMIWKTLREE